MILISRLAHHFHQIQTQRTPKKRGSCNVCAHVQPRGQAHTLGPQDPCHTLPHDVFCSRCMGLACPLATKAPHQHLSVTPLSHSLPHNLLVGRGVGVALFPSSRQATTAHFGAVPECSLQEGETAVPCCPWRPPPPRPSPHGCSLPCSSSFASSSPCRARHNNKEETQPPRPTQASCARQPTKPLRPGTFVFVSAMPMDVDACVVCTRSIHTL